MEIIGFKDNANSFLVTKISPAVKNENRVNIYINDKYEFSLDIAQVVDYKIKVGKLLSRSELEKLRHASEFGKLYQRTLEWVLMRPHSEKETREYLHEKRYKRELENRKARENLEKIKSETKDERAERKEREKKFKSFTKTKELSLFSDEDIEKVIARLKERDYLDDEKFAKYYLENRFTKKGISKKRLELELRQKGISLDIIESVFAENPRNELEEIQKIISKKRSRYNDDKLIAYLVRQGFDYQISKEAVCKKEEL